MSALFGIVAFDGRPISREALGHLEADHAGWGSDRHVAVRHGSAAMGVAVHAATEESAYDAMPLLDEITGTITVAIARLDNRDELADALSLPGPLRAITADSGLVALAYGRWGPSAVEHLLGDWSFAVWHIADRRLFVARDQMGSTGLFYTERGRVVAFASKAAALVTIEGESSPIDELQFARYVAIQPGEPDRTPWRDINGLPSGYALTAEASGVSVRRYWRPDDARDVRLGSTGEYVEAFLERYRRAIRTRLRGPRPVATTLSAGLDSSSLTALSAEVLRVRGQRLIAFTAGPMAPPASQPATSLADEVPLAADTAAWCGNVDHVIVRTAEVSPIAALQRALDCYPGLIHAAANLHWLIRICEDARARGLGAVLMGQLGNLGVSWEGSGPSAGLGLRGIAAWRAQRHVSWSTAIRSRVVGPIVRMIRRRGARAAAPPPWRANGALLPVFAARLDLDRVFSGADEYWARLLTWSPHAQRCAGLFLNAYAAGPVQHALGAAHGIELRDPTSDVRLVEFCLGVPVEQFADGSGSRLLMRRAMQGLLPPSVQWNYRRGQQSSDIVARLRAHERDVDDALARLGADRAVCLYLDVPRLEAIWQAARRGPTSPAMTLQASQILVRDIMAGFFLQRYGLDRSVRREAR